MNKIIDVRERYYDGYQKPREDGRDYEDSRIILSRYQNEGELRKVFFDENKKLDKH